MTRLGSFLTRSSEGRAALVLRYALYATLFAALTQVFAAWLEDESHVYFFYEGAERDFAEFPLLSWGALVAFPFAEEVVFRGPLAFVWKKTQRVSVLGWSALVLAAIFGLVHGALLPQAVSAIFFTVVFMRAYVASGNFLSAVGLAGCAHLISNAMLCFMQFAWNGWIAPLI